MKTKLKTISTILTLCLILLIISCSSSEKPTEPPLTGITIGNDIEFDAYQWRVLDIQGKWALIISKEILEKRVYHTTREDITWDICTLREYLNEEFYYTLSPENRERILLSTNQNYNNPSYDTYGGPVTFDKIFLLSIPEVLQYLPGRIDRLARYDGEFSSWWLRTPGNNGNVASFVYVHGEISFLGSLVDNNPGGVRPAMWIALY